MAPPFKEVEFDIIYGEGISKEGDLLDCAVKYDVVEKSGTWFSYKDERMGQGRENSKKWLIEHPEAIQEIRKLVLEKSGIAKVAENAAKTEEAPKAENRDKLPARGPAPATKAAPAKGRPARR